MLANFGVFASGLLVWLTELRMTPNAVSHGVKGLTSGTDNCRGKLFAFSDRLAQMRNPFAAGSGAARGDAALR